MRGVSHLLRSLQPKIPEPRSYVLIFTYGRSGSTLLMGLLNSLPGYCIRGENNNALHALFQYYRRLVDAPAGRRGNAEAPTHPWNGIQLLDFDQIQSEIRRLFVDTVLRPEPRHTTIGFKEIRFSAEEVPDFEAYLEFIRQTFPGAKFIFNHRNLAAVAASGWWKTVPDAIERLGFMEARFNDVPAGHSVYHFSYDALVADAGAARGLMDFLEQPYEPEAVKSLLATRYSY
jgi:hypothetical protein